ncbi:MAG: hypothetical protein WD382_01280 [Halofilum sp. (in: g-proteobacteria)]
MGANANWFIALPVDAGALPAGTLSGLPAGLQCLHPEDLHVTVAFLGALGEPRALSVWQEIAGLETDAFTVHSGARAALGNPRRPSAYGLDLMGGKTFVAWLGHWRDRLHDAAGLERETRALRPHVTLARPPRRAGKVNRQCADAWLHQDPPESVALRLDRIALYSAAGRASKRRYREVQTYALTRAE